MSERDSILYRMKGPHIVVFDDGTRIDLSHHFEVWKARKEKGLSVKEIQGKYIHDHPLIGKKLRSRETGEVYEVESAKRQWYGGWYVTLLLVCNGNHRLVYWENIDCYIDYMLKGLEETRQELEVLSDETD